MIAQDYITFVLSFNPSVAQLNQQANLLDERAAEILAEVQRERLHRGWNLTVSEYRRAQSMIATATALREMVIEAAAFLALPDALPAFAA